MKRQSAGLCIFRRTSQRAVEVLLVHPGGPYFRRKDAGAWSLPKGEPNPGEDLLEAARREVAEETGFRPEGPFIPLSCVRQRGGKDVHAWAVEADFDVSGLRSNNVEIQWPPRSGRIVTIPEVDRAAYFELTEARLKLIPAQTPFLDELTRALASATRPG